MCHISISINLTLHWIKYQLNLVKNIILALGSVAPWLCFLEVTKYCDSASILTSRSNLLVVFGIDNGLVWIISSMEALITPVVTCGVVYIKRCGMTNFVLGDRYVQLLCICLLKNKYPCPKLPYESIMSEMKSDIYIYMNYYIWWILKIFIWTSWL